ncbi:transposase [Clostridium estertheticum]|uniref:transposase n=1 Tax=Clostridium estertheticum TaxID=238834 RepID=UPI00271451C0|nr:transposase [Clostridium estertheticum]
MPRVARVKTDESIFHIMCKSISEVTLFKDDEDKKRYLLLIKKYKTLHNFKLYGYCLMDNHAHLMIDANGCDISKIMHGINFSYAMYFNRKYKREGHLFKDRFKSKIVYSDRYLRTLSLYVHNNPTDIIEYKDSPEKYTFSSLSIFLGKTTDSFNLVDYVFVMSLFGDNLKSARKNYYNLLFRCNAEKLKQETEFEDEKTDYNSERNILVRNFKSDDILDFVALKMNISKIYFYTKYNRNLVNAKALAVVLMRSLCNFKSKDIANILGNITQARISRLSTIGITLIGTEEKYQNIIGDFIKCYS